MVRKLFALVTVFLALTGFAAPFTLPMLNSVGKIIPPTPLNVIGVAFKEPTATAPLDKFYESKFINEQGFDVQLERILNDYAASQAISRSA